MFPELYTAASGMSAGRRSLELVANNLANARTPGFLPDRPVFTSYLPPARPGGARPSGIVTPRGVMLDRVWRPDQAGALRETEAPLDLALDGRGWFRIGTPAGERLTRDGAFTRSDAGLLAYRDGSPVLDTNGKPITIPIEEPVRIASDGTVSSGEEVVARLGLADADGVTLVREGEGLWRPDGSTRPLDMSRTSVRQGWIEESGVSATIELVSMIEAQRMFELHQRVVDVAANQVARQALSLAGVR